MGPRSLRGDASHPSLWLVASSADAACLRLPLSVPRADGHRCPQGPSLEDGQAPRERHPSNEPDELSHARFSVNRRRREWVRDGDGGVSGRCLDLYPAFYQRTRDDRRDLLRSLSGLLRRITSEGT